jgi:hypothetical protein
MKNKNLKDYDIKKLNGAKGILKHILNYSRERITFEQSNLNQKCTPIFLKNSRNLLLFNQDS